MKPAPFAYHRPASLAAMLQLLAANAEGGKVIAGGQSLVPAMNFRLARPDVLLDINGLSELDFLTLDHGVLRIGALTRHAAFDEPVAALPLARLLSVVAHHIAHYPIRQRGTFCGSLGHADPASEWCLVARTLDAEIVARSSASERRIPACEYFRGTFTTALRGHELITQVHLPLHDERWRGGFYEFARRAGDFALAMALAAFRVEAGAIAEARVGVGGVEDRPLRLIELEARMIGRAPEAALWAEIGDAARDLVKPVGDIHASAAYRKDLVGVVVKRALARVCA